MQAAALLLQALERAPRRFRPPALPEAPHEAQAAGSAAGVAWAAEAARRALQDGRLPDGRLRDLFVHALADLIRAALRPGGGDTAFQAMVLRRRAPEVAEHAMLASAAARDRRALRSAVDAVAHPGKWRHAVDEPTGRALTDLHRLACDGEWEELARLAQQMQRRRGHDESLHEALQALLAHQSLARLRRLEALSGLESVRGHLALSAGPAPGSAAARALGAASARRGAATEAKTVAAFVHIAAWLTQAAGGQGRYQVATGLLVPGSFPGEARKAKSEWDVALLQTALRGEGAQVLLLAEAKATPDAAVSDYSRMLRGLQRLALAAETRDHLFPTREGGVLVQGETLRRLAPQGRSLPPQVIYCCDAPGDVSPPVLSAASRWVLLTEPAAVAFACGVAEGDEPAPDTLHQVWEDLLHAPRLRSVLHQYDTACAALRAMFHPDDLRAALVCLT